MNPPTNTQIRGQKFTDTLLLLAAIAGCMWLLSQNLKMDAFGHRTLFQVMHGNDAPRWAALHEIDTIAQKAADRQVGNLLVSPDSDPRAVSILHPRAVYALWPKRLYAVQPDAVILDSNQIGPATRPADPQWLKDHHVTASVRFGIVDNHLTVERVDPISE